MYNGATGYGIIYLYVLLLKVQITIIHLLLLACIVWMFATKFVQLKGREILGR